MKTTEKGVVLITTLLMLCLIELIALSQMQLIILQVKSLNQLLRRQQHFSQLEQLAYSLINKKFLNQKNCIINESPSKISLYLKQHQGCFIRYQQKRYQYIIEDLGEFDCLVWLEENSKQFATHHWRLNLEDLSLNVILQIRKAEKIAKTNCKTIPRRITKQLLSWNYYSLV